MKKFIFFFSLFFLVSCLSAKAEVEICKNEPIGYKGSVAVGRSFYEVVYNKDIDLSEQIKRIDEFGSVSIYPTSWNLHSKELGQWISSIKVDILTDDGPVSLAKTVVDADSENVSVIPNKSINIFHYIKNGKLQLAFTMTGTAPASIKVDSNVCFLVSAEADRKL